MLDSRFLCILLLFCFAGFVNGETLRHPPSSAKQLAHLPTEVLAKEVRKRGDARRGALVFYKSAAACASCHLSEKSASPLGPALSQLGKITDAHVVESLLKPSKSIRKGYETHSVLTVDGELLVGMIAKQDEQSMTLRVATNLAEDKVIAKDDIDAIKQSDVSMMPDGLVASLGEQRDFLDLAKYVMVVAEGGAKAAQELQPAPEELVVEDDTVNLDHAGIIKKLRQRDYDSGQAIYHGYCFNCHGNDGNTPSLPTARAFGTQKLKFGSDPYKMFMTLSRGNGLMAPMSHLTPQERYQVVHYIREQFMKPSNEDYFEVIKEYLASLPEGTDNGTQVKNVQRDHGPALASQLERRFSSVLTIKLGDANVSYDLNSMDLAGIWKGGFLDLSNTQHVRDRGEGTADPLGEPIDGLDTWQWAHDQTFDYSRVDLLPRGPMPAAWMQYQGHYLSGNRVTLRYSIDGRPVLESPREDGDVIIHSFEIGPGKALQLAVGQGDQQPAVLTLGASKTNASRGDVAETFVSAARGQRYLAAAAIGETDGLEWLSDDQHRLILRIPAGEEARTIEVHRSSLDGSASLVEFGKRVQSKQSDPLVSPRALTSGGPLLWEEQIKTVGTLGLEPGGYALDTITIPDHTPWNTWFRTSAVGFFQDGRMVVSTYGGDVWVVSGVDDDLMNLRWKRFAGGLYEPFGIKVVDEKVYVTCKDRLTRLHDQDGNGEADFYESFSADPDVSVNFHAFNFDLQTDPDGNFYYSKSGHGGDSEIPGCIVKISPDGKQRDVHCTGFRTPNGMGMLPDGRPTVSDNQGQWTPASKVIVAEPGSFHGWVQTYSIPGMWEPGGGKIDIKKIVPPKSFDPPLVWMPQDFDNSSGGQLWVDDPRWGPLSGRLLHTSFGKGWLSYNMMQDVDGLLQAAIIKVPFDFRTGIMRARVNPADGQVYATGLQGWNGGGRMGLRDNGIQRLRYTGKEYRIVSDCQVEADGLRVAFNFPLDADSATELGSYVAEHWNYHWRAEYGSDRYSPTTDKPGVEKMNVESITLGSDGKSVKLNIPNLKPVNQVHLVLKLKGQDGEPFEEEIYWTINRVPSR
ncbi:MAG: DUF6797 domain-containing protein [Rubripirellula sp.]